MYYLLIDIPGYRQVSKLQAAQTAEFNQHFQQLVIDTGVTVQNVQAGRWVLQFRDGRPYDGSFIAESAYAFFELVKKLTGLPLGYGLILELFDQTETIAADLQNLLLKASDREGFWLGQHAASALATLIQFEKQGDLWRAITKIDKTQAVETFPHFFQERYLSAEQGKKRCLKLLGAGCGALFLEAQQPSDIGTFVERTIAQLLGPRLERHYLWIQGHVADELPTTSLCRRLSAAYLDEISALLEGDELGQWEIVRFFLQPTQAQPVLFSLEQNVSQAWFLLMVGAARLASRLGIPLILFIENADQLHEPDRKILRQSLEHLQKIGATNILLIATQPDDNLRFSPIIRQRDFWHIDRVQLTKRGNESDALTASMTAWLKVQFPDQNWLLVDEAEIHNQIFLSLSTLSLELYLVVLLTFGLLSVNTLSEFMSDRSVERVRIPPCLTQLHHFGLLRLPTVAVPVFGHAPEDVAKHLPDQGQSLRQALQQFLQKQVQQRHMPISADIFSIGIELFDDQFFLRLSFNYGCALIESGLSAEVERVISHLSVRGARLTNKQLSQSYLQAVAYLNARELLNTSRFAELELAIGHLQQLGGEQGEFGPYMALQQARWYYLQGQLDQAYRSVKQAMFDFQELQDQRGIAAAQIMFGLIRLGQAKLINSREYFLLARGTAVAAQAVFEELYAGWLELITLFLASNYSRVLQTIDDPSGITSQAQKHGMQELVVALIFLRSRVLFEIGVYHEAEKSFAAAANRADTILPALAQACQAWAQRARLYRNPKAALADEALETTIEGFLAKIENHLLKEQFGPAIDLIDSAPNWLAYHIPSPEALFSQNSLTSLEGRLTVSQHQFSVWENLIGVYRAYALAHAGKAQKGAQSLFKRLRVEGLLTNDPYAYVYLFLYSRTLRLADTTNLDDADTILGRSVKIFQERSSRIENPIHRQSFLRLNYWNKALLADAKLHNLA